MKRTIGICTLSALIMTLAMPVLAGETVSDKVKSESEKADMNSKKMVRKAKREKRDRTGKKNVLKDTQDEMKNSSDSLQHGINDAKRK